MVDYKCEEKLPDGSPCGYDTSKVKNKIQGIRGHYNMKHKKDWPGDAKLEELGNADTDELSPDEEWKAQESKFRKENIYPNDPFDALRQIMHNNGCDKWREATISLFQNYKSEDYEGLEQIMADQHIPPVQRNMVLKTYRAMMGAPVEGETEAEEAPGKKKVVYRDPTTVDAAEIANMSESDKQKWRMDLAKYAQAVKFQTEQTDQLWAAMGLGGSGKMQSGQLPPEVQAIVNEFKEMKERERRQQELAPLYRQIEALTQAIQQQQSQGPKSGTDVKAIMDTAMAYKALDAISGTKEGERLKAELDAKMEQERSASQERMQGQQMLLEKMKSDNQQLQMANLTQNFNAQMALLQQQMANQASTKEDMVSTLKKVMELSDAVNQFRGGAAVPGVGGNIEMVKTLVNGLGPGLLRIGEGFLAMKSGQQRPSIQPPMMPPMENQPLVVQEQQPTAVIDCSKCHNQFPVYGNPPMVKCPNCGQPYGQKGTAAQSMVQPTVASGRPAPEPTDQEIIEALKMEPREVLDAKAIELGLDPTIFPNKESLAEALSRMRK